jgi:hypothetical protein
MIACFQKKEHKSTAIRIYQQTKQPNTSIDQGQSLPEKKENEIEPLNGSGSKERPEGCPGLGVWPTKALDEVSSDPIGSTRIVLI